MARRITAIPGATMTRTTRASTMNTKYPTSPFVISSRGKTRRAGAHIRLRSSYQTSWKINRRTESKLPPCLGRCCGDVEAAVVLCPFRGTPVGDVFVTFAGGDGDWGDGPA